MSVGFMLLFFLKNLFQVALIIYVILSWYNNVYHLTKDHLIKREGIIKIRERVFNLGEISSVKVYQSPLGKVFNYGDIIITTNDSGNNQEDLYLTGISNPKEYRQMLK